MRQVLEGIGWEYDEQEILPHPEIETKILEIDPEAVERQLLSLWAEKVFDGILITHYYTVKRDAVDEKTGKIILDEETGKPKKEKIKFRVRFNGKDTVLTWKIEAKTDRDEPSHCRHNHETEILITHINGLQKKLEAAGCVFKRRVQKHRKSYLLKDENGNKERDLHFDLDEYIGIPALLEIEGSSEDDVYRWAELLKYTREQLSADSFGELREKYRGKIGIDKPGAEVAPLKSLIHPEEGITWVLNHSSSISQTPRSERLARRIRSFLSSFLPNA